MDVTEIYENALALGISRIDEEDNLDFYAVKLFNILLTEVKQYDDQIKIKKGKIPPEQPQKIEKIQGSVNIEPELYAAMSYGMAAKLLAAQEDTGLGTMYNNQYITMLQMVTPAVDMEVL